MDCWGGGGGGGGAKGMLAPSPKLLGGPGPPWPPLCVPKHVTDKGTMKAVVDAARIYRNTELFKRLKAKLHQDSCRCDESVLN